MKKLDVTPITNAAQMPVKKGTLQFLQDAYTEITATTVKALIGANYNPAIVYVLSGGQNSATPPSYAIVNGSVFFNGEIFNLITSSFTAGAGNVAVFALVQTQYTTDADPVTFTDGTARNVHNIRQVQVQQGVSGSGLSDYSQAFFLNFAIPPQLQLVAPTTPAQYADNSIQVFGAYPNVSIYAKTPPSLAFPVLAAGNLNIGDLGAGGGNVDFTITFPTPVSTANYIVIGSTVSNGNPRADSTAIWSVRQKSTSGFLVTFTENPINPPPVQNISWDWILIKTS